MAEEGEGRAMKLAMNQSVFRTSNERLERSAEGYGFEGYDRVPFLCECADPGCREVVMASIQEYERVRAHPTWFLVVAGHEDEDADHERIVDDGRGYVIVEKIGSAGAEAARLHPR